MYLQYSQGSNQPWQYKIYALLYYPSYNTTLNVTQFGLQTGEIPRIRTLHCVRMGKVQGKKVKLSL
jgi:hypothetical protein